MNFLLDWIRALKSIKARRRAAYMRRLRTRR
jgi:hypothetical protein